MIRFDENGTATVLLKRNETITITGFLCGFDYMITETNSDGYLVRINGNEVETAQIAGENVTDKY